MVEEICKDMLLSHASIFLVRKEDYKFVMKHYMNTGSSYAYGMPTTYIFFKAMDDNDSNMHVHFINVK